jgi:hypothetical protein
MKWEDVDVMRIYMKSGAVFQYYDFSNLIAEPMVLSERILTMTSKVYELKIGNICHFFRVSEIESIEFEVKHGS